jgi:hypothetical protein
MDGIPPVLRGVEKGLHECARIIMDDSQVLVPRDTETLANSAYITDVEVIGQDLVVHLGYGRGEEINPKTGDHPSKYAVPVHEILGAFHKPPTQAKFLEVPAVAFEAFMGEVMKVWISKYVAGAGLLESGSSEGLISRFDKVG